MHCRPLQSTHRASYSPTLESSLTFCSAAAAAVRFLPFFYRSLICGPEPDCITILHVQHTQQPVLWAPHNLLMTRFQKHPGQQSAGCIDICQDLLTCADMCSHVLMSACCAGPRNEKEKVSLNSSLSIGYGREIGVIMLIYIMALAYAASSPIILPFTLCYFITAWVSCSATTACACSKSLYCIGIVAACEQSCHFSGRLQSRQLLLCWAKD